MIPIFTRTPAVLASTFSVIEQAYPGRFIPGLGTSSHAIIEGWHGLPFENRSPVQRGNHGFTEDHAGGRKTGFEGVKCCAAMVTVGLPRYLFISQLCVRACLKPQPKSAMALFSICTHAAPCLRLLSIFIQAREKAGNWPRISRSCQSRQMTVVTDDKASARAAFRAAFSAYYSTPVYNKFLAWCGFEEAAEEIREGWANRTGSAPLPHYRMSWWMTLPLSARQVNASNRFAGVLITESTPRLFPVFCPHRRSTLPPTSIF